MIKSAVWLLMLSFAANARAQQSLDPRTFINDMAARVKAQYPRAKVMVRKPLEVVVKDKRNGIDNTMWLDRIFDLCSRQNAHCDSERHRVLMLLGQATGAPRETAARNNANLRVIVRYADAFNATAATFRSKGKSVIHRPPTDGLILVLAVDLPDTLSWATTGDFPKDAVQQEALFEVGLSNTFKELSNDAASRTLSVGGFTLIAGNTYDSSCIADHERWAVAARAAKGRFLVAVPGADACLFGEAKSDTELGEFRMMARNIAERAQRAVSNQIYQWMPDGWIKVE